MAPESLLRPFGGLDPGVSRLLNQPLGVSSHCLQTKSLRDMVLWLMTCEADGPECLQGIEKYIKNPY